MKTYSAKILADSIACDSRLTTMEVVMPRIILPEFNTHREFSRNSASSRAVPVAKKIKEVRENPFIPTTFLKNIKGMAGGEPLSETDQILAREAWIAASVASCVHAEHLMLLNVAKQYASRILEPYLWHTVIVSSTKWDNFFNLRIHPDAQPEIQIVARLMKEALDNSKPLPGGNEGWHMPFIRAEDIEEACKDYNQRKHGGTDEMLVKIAIARAARVSYETHDKGIIDIDADLRLHDSLIQNGHLSPAEHCAKIVEDDDIYYRRDYGNFSRPWLQYRKMIPNEKCFKRNVK